MEQMERFQEIDDLALRTEGLFGKLMSKVGLGAQNTGAARALGGGRYAIGSNEIQKLGGVAEDEFLKYDWNNGKLSFLTKGQWTAKELVLQISQGVEQVVRFAGVWRAGAFVGNFFGDFQGESFEGHFQSAFNSYRSGPSTFVNGKVTSFDRGVIGVPKLEVTSLDKSSQKRVVSLLEMRVGHYCNLTDDQGVTHSFQMTKCCDSTNMDIELKEETGQKRGIRIPWTEMRKSDDPNEFRRLSSIRIGGRPQIPYLFANDRVGAITNIEISTKPTMFGTTVDTYLLDTTLLRPLSFPVAKVTIHLFSPEEVMKFGQIHQDLSNNAMQLHLRNITDGIKFKLITGYKGYPHLAGIFNNVEGQAVKHPKYATSMKWLDEFVQYVLLRMMRSRTVGGSYVNNERGRKILTTALNSLITKAGIAPPQAAPAPGPTAVPPKKRNVARSMIPESASFSAIDQILNEALKQKGR